MKRNIFGSLQINSPSPLTQTPKQKSNQPKEPSIHQLLSSIQSNFAQERAEFNLDLISSERQFSATILCLTTTGFEILSEDKKETLLLITFKDFPQMNMNFSRDNELLLRLAINNEKCLVLRAQDTHQRHIILKTFYLFKTYQTDLENINQDSFKSIGNCLSIHDELEALSQRCAHQNKISFLLDSNFSKDEEKYMSLIEMTNEQIQVKKLSDSSISFFLWNDQITCSLLISKPTELIINLGLIKLYINCQTEFIRELFFRCFQVFHQPKPNLKLPIFFKQEEVIYGLSIPTLLQKPQNEVLDMESLKKNLPEDPILDLPKNIDHFNFKAKFIENEENDSIQQNCFLSFSKHCLSFFSHSIFSINFLKNIKVLRNSKKSNVGRIQFDKNRFFIVKFKNENELNSFSKHLKVISQISSFKEDQQAQKKMKFFPFEITENLVNGTLILMNNEMKIVYPNNLYLIDYNQIDKLQFDKNSPTKIRFLIEHESFILNFLENQIAELSTILLKKKEKEKEFIVNISFGETQRNGKIQFTKEGIIIIYPEQEQKDNFKITEKTKIFYDQSQPKFKIEFEEITLFVNFDSIILANSFLKKFLSLKKSKSN